MAPLILSDAVEQVIDKLPSHVTMVVPQLTLSSSTLVQEAQQTLRILTSQCPPQLTSFDRSETRAAVVLAHVGKKHAINALTPELLAQAAALKISNFRKLAAMLRPYLLHIATASSTSAALPAPPLVGGQKRPRHYSSSSMMIRHRHHPPPSRTTRSDAPPLEATLLPTLGIQLHAHIDATNRIVQRARQLVYDIQHYYTTDVTLDVNARRGLLHDLRRYWDAYQAASVLVVTNHDVRASKKNKKKTLTIQTFCQAASHIHPLELQQVYPQVTQLYHQFKNMSHDANEHHPAATTLLDSTTTSDANWNLLLPSNTNEQIHKEMSQYDKLEAWRHEIVQSALDDVRQQQRRDEADNDDGEELSHNRSDNEALLLERAAHNVLQRYGLVADKTVTGREQRP